jgi:hypothetical protein
MEEVGAAAAPLSDAAARRLERAWDCLRAAPIQPAPPAVLAERLDTLLHARA